LTEVRLTRDVVRLGLNIADYRSNGYPNAFERLSALVTAGEAAGFDSFWAGDHLMSEKAAPGGSWLELYTTLGALAVRTSTIRLGALVGAVLFRNPAFLAKTVTTLDIISNGRALFGIGSGSHQGEHLAYGYAFPDTATRTDILREAVQLVTAMFREEVTTFEGKWVQAYEARNTPRPISPGGPPVLIGGTGRRRTLRLVARYADLANFTGPDRDVPELNDVLDEHCMHVGRCPSEVARTMFKPVILARSRQEAEEQMTPWQREYQGLLGFITGSRDEVVERVGSLVGNGIDGLIVQLPADHNTIERVSELGELLRPVVGSLPNNSR
jgi:alkanesulfonate monooxygenase SsuD/methylene tetrahydromethanopterin reductase-like flavin-dependent oxidoreductase (luciferase family)